MTTFCFVRHGQMDMSQAGQRFYKGFAFNMMTLSPAGEAQIRETARDPRLQGAQLIVTSPYGRTMHSAAILSRALDLDIRVETDLHEWLADGVSYEYLSTEEAVAAFQLLHDHNGEHPAGMDCRWESAGIMRRRVHAVLNRYLDYDRVIVMCHGTLMQYVLGIPHPENGEVYELTVTEAFSEV